MTEGALSDRAADVYQLSWPGSGAAPCEVSLPLYQRMPSTTWTESTGLRPLPWDGFH